MEVYKITNLDNGDILLEKIIFDKTDFIILNKENGDKLLKKIKTINITNTNIDELKLYEFKKSKIINCCINSNIITKLKYKTVLEYIYQIINDGVKIIKNSKLNIKTIQKEDDGFYYLDKIGISIQCAESNKCVLELAAQCCENKIAINIKIKTEDDTVININM